MSACTIAGCPSEAVAKGLCAMHYMRVRRGGDPNAEFKPRQPKPRSGDPEMDVLREEVAELRQQLALRVDAKSGNAVAALFRRITALSQELRKTQRQLSEAPCRRRPRRRGRHRHARPRDRPAHGGARQVQGRQVRAK
jgi:hypothetical protein